MKKDKFNILVVDDEDSIRNRCVQLLQRKGYTVRGVNDGEQALFIIKKDNLSLVIADIRMPGLNGIDLLEKIKETHPDIEVVMITGYGTIDNAVEAMKLGAYDYITKPFDMDRLLKVVEHIETKFALKNEIGALKDELKKFSAQHDFIGVSDEVQHIFQLVQKISPIDCNVLIQGESGTGKGLLAHAIHSGSPRNKNPFVVVDCAALTESLLESELFGYMKGAFTGAYANKEGYFKIADKGTIFLDEISELSTSLQGKLLRMAQDHEIIPVGGTKPVKINTRILAATNRNLEQRVKEGKFREDLYFRINVVKIDIPPLRERKEDIAPLTHFFFDKFKKRFDKNILSIDQQVLDFFQRYEWPGNVRELENVVQRMVITADKRMATMEDLPEKMRFAMPEQANEGRDTLHSLDFTEARKRCLDSFTREYLVDALRHCQGNISKTAKEISIQRPSIQRMIKRYDIRKEEYM
ncbi:MAG TPA: sigma-54 dependent transcriptional regulator [Syntrophorhabdaceae bacterium]|nr:sigma-54 dependent transcriptional regulator [Syntrophorhabdaceae bacterium]HQM81975.1 sigma-54 dependent transcriptional regulator [Syntrophorhabdaceae bacterium]